MGERSSVSYPVQFPSGCPWLWDRAEEWRSDRLHGPSDLNLLTIPLAQELCPDHGKAHSHGQDLWPALGGELFYFMGEETGDHVDGQETK